MILICCSKEKNFIIFSDSCVELGSISRFKLEIDLVQLVQEPIFKRGPNKGVDATPTTHLVCHFRLLGGCLWNISSPVVELNCGNTKKL